MDDELLPGEDSGETGCLPSRQTARSRKQRPEGLRARYHWWRARRIGRKVLRLMAELDKKR